MGGGVSKSPSAPLPQQQPSNVCSFLSLLERLSCCRHEEDVLDIVGDVLTWNGLVPRLRAVCIGWQTDGHAQRTRVSVVGGKVHRRIDPVVVGSLLNNHNDLPELISEPSTDVFKELFEVSPNEHEIRIAGLTKCHLFVVPVASLGTTAWEAAAAAVQSITPTATPGGGASATSSRTGSRRSSRMIPQQTPRSPRLVFVFAMESIVEFDVVRLQQSLQVTANFVRHLQTQRPVLSPTPSQQQQILIDEEESSSIGNASENSLTNNNNYINHSNNKNHDIVVNGSGVMNGGSVSANNGSSSSRRDQVLAYSSTPPAIPNDSNSNNVNIGFGNALFGSQHRSHSIRRENNSISIDLDSAGGASPARIGSGSVVRGGVRLPIGLSQDPMVTHGEHLIMSTGGSEYQESIRAPTPFSLAVGSGVSAVSAGALQLNLAALSPSSSASSNNNNLAFPNSNSNNNANNVNNNNNNFGSMGVGSGGSGGSGGLGTGLVLGSCSEASSVEDNGSASSGGNNIVASSIVLPADSSSLTATRTGHQVHISEMETNHSIAPPPDDPVRCLVVATSSGGGGGGAGSGSGNNSNNSASGGSGGRIHLSPAQNSQQHVNSSGTSSGTLGTLGSGGAFGSGIENNSASSGSGVGPLAINASSFVRDGLLSAGSGRFYLSGSDAASEGSAGSSVGNIQTPLDAVIDDLRFLLKQGSLQGAEKEILQHSLLRLSHRSRLMVPELPPDVDAGPLSQTTRRWLLNQMGLEKRPLRAIGGGGGSASISPGGGAGGGRSVSPTTVSSATSHLSRSKRSLTRGGSIEIMVSADSTCDLMTNMLTNGGMDLDMFAVDDISGGSVLTVTGFFVFDSLGLISDLKLDSDKLLKFLSIIEKGYRASNPYHNATHAADVAFTCYWLLVNSPGYVEALSQLEQLALLLACIIHDYDHPGCNQNFQINSRSDLTITYNDRSVLENHHLAASFRVLLSPDCNFLSHLTPAEFKEFRWLVIENVLATDMTAHFGFVSNLKTVAQSEKTDFDVALRTKTLIKIADLGHCCKCRNVHCKWSNLITEEFFRQGDREKQLGIAVSAFCDRDKDDMIESQTGFFEFVIVPFINAAYALFPLPPVVQQNVLDNAEFWRVQKERGASPPTTESFSIASESIPLHSHNSPRSIQLPPIKESTGDQHPVTEVKPAASASSSS